METNFIKLFYEKYKEFISYSVVGVSLTFANWLIYAACIERMPMLMANIFSWMVVVIMAYVGNKVFVFQNNDWEIHNVFREMITYFGARGATGVVEVFAQPMLFQLGINQSLFGVSGLPAKILVSLIVMVMNYSCTKLLVFRQSDAKIKRPTTRRFLREI